MSESAIADFVARVIPDTAVTDEPEQGRVLLSRKRLVFALEDGQTTIPLTSIFDVAVGHVPTDVSEFFDDTVTVGYERDGDRTTALVEADGETIDRFVRILFKALLNGTEATVKHPARVGGRVTDAEPRIGRLKLADRAVEFVELEEPFTVDLSSVTHFERTSRRIGDRECPALAVRHMPEGRSLTSEVALSSGRKMNVLGRYLRLEYSDIMADLREMEVPEGEKEILVAIYSGGDESSLPRLLGENASRITMLLESLEEKGLVHRGDDSIALTSQGRMVVGDRIEDVNT